MIERLIARRLRTIAQHIEAWSLQHRGKIQIPPSVRLSAHQVQWQEDCILSLGKHTQVEGRLVFERPQARIKIGSRCFINGTLAAAQSIEIGDDVMTSWGVTIVDHDSHSPIFSQRKDDVVHWLAGHKNWQYVKMAPVKICDKAWIGFNVILLKGVTIGEGAVVGAGAVVTKDIPAWTVAAGNPAKVIRELPSDER